MKLRISLVALLVALTLPAVGVAETLDVKSLASNRYAPRSFSSVTPLADGEHYAMMTAGKNAIVRCSFRSGEVVDTLFSTANCRGCDFRTFDGYLLSPQEDRILIRTHTNYIYRRSYTADHYIYSVRNRKMEPLSAGGPQQVPCFSPDGKMIAFVRDNDIWLVKLLFNNAESRVTADGVRNSVINGHADWVYEEEFTMTRFFEFSADSKMIAYVKSVETEVPQYSFPLFKGSHPTLSDCDLYPGAYTYKYPVPGVKNSVVTVHTFDIKSSVTRQMEVPMDADGYIPRIHFINQTDADGGQTQLAIVTLNRHQSRMDLYVGNARSTVCRLVLREENPQGRWLRESTYQDLAWLPDGFVLQSERTGRNGLYLYDFNGRLVRPLAVGDYDVTAFYGYDAKSGTTYAQSCLQSPLTRVVCAYDKKGICTPLTAVSGTHDAIFSSSLKHFIHTASSMTEAPHVSLEVDRGAKTVTAPFASVNDYNASLAARLTGAGMPTREFFTFTTPEGIELNGWMVKPADMAPGRRYPVIMYQYSGPDSQEVADKWGIGFYGGLAYECLLAQHGFIVACVDGRGTGFRGEEFRGSIYLQLGLLEAQDQVSTARWLATQPYVDASLIGIWGWSYGGFMTLMSMSEPGANAFAAGIAVAAPTCWRYYDSIYTERFMQTPQENGTNYDAITPIARAPYLHGRLLLVHGMADDNVHFRNAAEYSEALVQADKQFEMQVYTNRNHGISGGNTRAHLFQRMLDFWQRELAEKK